ncbi:Uncharacterised protein [Legionella pneumophila]|nr:Uncharacterised protein [Legionella pneumophila]
MLGFTAAQPTLARVLVSLLNNFYEGESKKYFGRFAIFKLVL